MPRKFSAAELAACGEITESEMEPLVRGRFRVPQLRYVWRPSGLTASQLPPNFELTLEAYLGSDGVRRFHDANAHVYARKAFAAGVAILVAISSAATAAEKLIEEIKACVVLKDGASASPEEIIKWTSERIAAYKYPRVVELLDALPMSATGKILKKDLRKQG